MRNFNVSNEEHYIKRSINDSMKRLNQQLIAIDKSCWKCLIALLKKHFHKKRKPVTSCYLISKRTVKLCFKDVAISSLFRHIKGSSYLKVAKGTFHKWSFI